MSKDPRGTCQECRGWFALTRAGMVWTHKGRGTPLCPGSGTAPGMTEADTMDAQVTRESVPVAPANQVLMQPDRAEPKRDRWGRYLLPHPDTGKGQAWTRATTFASSASDTFALSQWSQRMAFKGAALRPDLVSLAHGLDVKADRDRMNKLVEDAKEAAGQKVAANLGTALHSFTEAVDRGGPLGAVPPQHREDVAAYAHAMGRAGLETHPDLTERITAVPEFGVAGTFDRVLRLPDGTHSIGDLKTGKDLKYAWHEIVIQLALYAHGVNRAGLWDPETQAWVRGPEVRTDFGIVMHLPVGKAECILYRIDLIQGWEAAGLCHSVRKWRTVKGLAEPMSPPVPAAPETAGTLARQVSWEELFATAGSREDLASLFDEAAAQSLGEARMAELTRIGMQRLAGLAG